MTRIDRRSEGDDISCNQKHNQSGTLTEVRP